MQLNYNSNKWCIRKYIEVLLFRKTKSTIASKRVRIIQKNHRKSSMSRTNHLTDRGHYFNGWNLLTALALRLLMMTLTDDPDSGPVGVIFEQQQHCQLSSTLPLRIKL